MGRLRWRRRVASYTISAIDGFRPLTRLRRTHLGPAAVSLRTGATVIAWSSAAVIALAATAIAAALTLARTAATTAAAIVLAVLAAAAVSAGRALTLGGAFRRVDERGRKHHSRRDEP